MSKLLVVGIGAGLGVAMWQNMAAVGPPNTTFVVAICLVGFAAAYISGRAAGRGGQSQLQVQVQEQAQEQVQGQDQRQMVVVNVGPQVLEDPAREAERPSAAAAGLRRRNGSPALEVIANSAAHRFSPSNRGENAQILRARSYQSNGRSGSAEPVEPAMGGPGVEGGG